MPSEPSQRRSFGSLVLRYALAGLILAGVFAAVPFGETWRVVGSASGPAVVWATVLFTGSRWIGCLRTASLVRSHGVAVGIARLFEISCASTLYGLALPGSLSGGLIRWHRIGQLQRSHGEAAGVIGFERLVDWAVLLWLGLAAWLTDPAAPRSLGLTWALALGALGFSLAGGSTLTRLPSRLSQLLSRDGSKSGRLRDAAVRTLSALPRHGSPASLVSAVGLSLLLHLVATAGLTALAGALSLELAYVTMLWLRAFTVVITAAPVTPAGLGVREIGTVFLLGLIGVVAADAVALSLLQFAMLLFFAALGACFELRRQTGRALA